MNKILVLGSGELGHSIITSLYQHPVLNASSYTITVTVRPSTLQSASADRKAQLDQYQADGIAVLGLDIESDPIEELASQLEPFTTIIHAGGMTLTPGTQVKLTQAVLASALQTNSEKLYIPWQFGLDYDAIGPSAGNGLFAEQYRIRELLRAQSRVKWVIVSNGIFTSFMFEPVWSMVERVTTPDFDTELVCRALGSWDNELVYTTAEDIARCTAELVLVDTDMRGRPVFIAGDHLRYGEVADLVEKVSKTKVRRELWSSEYLEQKMDAEPENKLWKYHVVFAQPVGTAWPVQDTYNARKGIKMTSVEEWLNSNFRVG